MKTRQLTTDTWNQLIDLIEFSYTIVQIENAPLTAIEIRDLLQTLIGESRLDASAIKNLYTGSDDGEPPIFDQLTAIEIRDLLQTLIGESRLDASAIKGIHASMVSMNAFDFNDVEITNVNSAILEIINFIETLDSNNLIDDLLINTTQTWSSFKINQTIEDAITNGPIDWSIIVNTPTTLVGYGITDAYTKTEIQSFYSGAVPITGYNNDNWDLAHSWGDHSGLYLQNVVEDLTPQLGGNLDVQDNDIYTSTLNGHITIVPNGTGDIILGTSSTQSTLIVLNDGSAGLFNASSNGIVRHSVSSLGLSTWRLNNTAAEAGQIQFTTPAGGVGIAFWTGATYDQNRFDIRNEGTHFSLIPQHLPLGEGLNITQSNGFVGIGKSTAATQLDVEGTTTSTDFLGNTFNGVALTTAGSSTNFLNEQGNYVAVGGGGATQLSDLTDVNTSTPTNRNVLVADGVDWESRALVSADISDLSIGYVTLGTAQTITATKTFNTGDTNPNIYSINSTNGTGIYSETSGNGSGLTVLKTSGTGVGIVSSISGPGAGGVGILSQSTSTDPSSLVFAGTTTGAPSYTFTVNKEGDVVANSYNGVLLTTAGLATDFLNAEGNYVAVGGGATQLSELTDVNTSTPTNRNVLIADGVDWESRALVSADISDLNTGYVTLNTSQTITGSKTFNSGTTLTNIVSNNTLNPTGAGILATNSASGGFAISAQNSVSNGFAIYAVGGSGKGVTASVTSTGDGFYANGNSTGRNIFSQTSGSGNSIVSSINTGGTGFAFVGQNNLANTFTVNKTGDVVANSFTGDGSGLTGILNATGTPVVNQIAIFTNATTIKGESNLTYDSVNAILDIGVNSDVSTLNANGSTLLSYNHLTEILFSPQAIESPSFILQGGNGSQFLMADGSVKMDTNKRIVASISSTYNLDHSLASDWKLTLTADTTFTHSNLPTGTNTTEFTIKMTGAFVPTFPAYWGTIQGDAYDGSVWNFFSVQVHNGTTSSEEFTVFNTLLTT